MQGTQGSRREEDVRYDPNSLEDEGTRKVFGMVVDQRRVRFKDLQESLNLGREEARGTLKRLQEARLIEERRAPFEDFSLYYVTAAGLEAAREIRRRERLTRDLSLV